ncbi:glycogen/starch/alpha-glucan phosphorylase [Sanguibacter gelidistatuariae]|uniref:glycogen/starch/alpha-glucan phosphorylase n=1 Tax=Sanguibacter gelidistatuariae TaxID=1814289 RepID=UPI000B8175AF|nr:glycogen/starch/alpha-glucan phosphorylase [Sanguibacter gelidistatuariae]
MTETTQEPPSSPVTVSSFADEFVRQLRYEQGVDLNFATKDNLYQALAGTVRGFMIDNWLATLRTQQATESKIVAYLSAEYLLGPQLENALLATGLESLARGALTSLGLDLDDLEGIEIEPGLGNGGLGRLAACFIDSLATLNIPAVGYGIRYEYGIFRQTFVDGRQAEQPDTWLSKGSPWEFPHPDMAVEVGFGGYTEQVTDETGGSRTRWVPSESVSAVPYNYMVPGYGTHNVNTLRLWSAKATNAFDLQIFNSGDYEAAVRAQTVAENISKVLYPEDSTPQGKELRLKQQYFFVAASITDFITRLLPDDFALTNLPDRVTFQLNDTHPVIAIPELMRILVDERGLDWDVAWDVTRASFNYTCHTLLPEALEVWSVELLGRLLPRHLEIIYRINEQFLAGVRAAFPGDELRARRMSIVQEQPERAVRMAFLATVASSKVNGVAALHSELLRDKVLNDFSGLWPEKFTNVTNGVTPRRFIKLSNPGLSELIDAAIGTGWVNDLERLRELEPFAEDASFRAAFRTVKAENKKRFVDLLATRDGIELSSDALFDVMVKRLHEYKRQMLKVLHVITTYDRVLKGELRAADLTPRVVTFGAKAAPGYRMAKEIIALINAVAKVVNTAPELEGRLRIAFPANYNVTLAEKLIPAADLSEQISLAGKEASGTGNMKFALNGALTIGTLDGANVEIYDLVGADNFFLFGLTEPEVQDISDAGYRPGSYYEANASLRGAIDLIASGAFSGGDRTTFQMIVSDLLDKDRFMVLADYQAYIEAQDKVDVAYADQEAWSRAAILNVARSGFFSSDRSIRDYLDRIWHASPVPVVK